MHRTFFRLLMVFLFTLAFSALLTPVSAQTATPELQLVPPAPGAYVIPQGWREERSEKNVILSVPGDKALIYLWIYRNDKRETWQVVDEFVTNQSQQKGFKWTLVNKNIYRYGDKEVAKVTINQEAKGRPNRQEFVLAIPIDGGNLFMLVNAIESSLGEYENAINSVMNPLLPPVPGNATPYPVSSANVGLKLMVAPDWHTKPESRGERSGAAYLEITNGNALFSLSSDVDPRSPEEYVALVEKNIGEQSKNYENLAASKETVAGIPATRLEVRTTAHDSKIPIKRWVFVFSRNNRHYVVAAAAPESEFEKFTGVFKQMIASVALTE